MEMPECCKVNSTVEGKQALIQVKYGDARVLQSEQHKKRGKTGQVKYGAGTNKVKYGAARVLRSEQHTKQALIQVK